MDVTPQVGRVLDGMSAREAAGFIRYFESIEAHPGDHPQSWSTMVPHIWATEADSCS